MAKYFFNTISTLQLFIFAGEIINIIQSEDFVICQAKMIQLSRFGSESYSFSLAGGRLIVNTHKWSQPSTLFSAIDASSIPDILLFYIYIICYQKLLLLFENI